MERPHLRMMRQQLVLRLMAAPKAAGHQVSQTGMYACCSAPCSADTRGNNFVHHTVLSSVAQAWK